MLVQEWMTEDVITVTEDTSMMKASRLIKENKIRRLPVVNTNGELVGIVSDHDIKDASPSRATTLEVHELYYLLSELKVKDIMTKSPIFAYKHDTVEKVAQIMLKNNFGGVPVVDSENKICGIITDTDIFKVFLSVTGIEYGGIQLAFTLPDTVGSLRPIVDTLRAENVEVVSVLTSRKGITDKERRVYIRLSPLEEKKQEEILQIMKEKFGLSNYEPALGTE